MSLKFKVGDKVRIKKDLKMGISYYNEDKKGKDTLVHDMLHNLGKETIIKEILQHNRYGLEIDKSAWGWVEEMLEEVKEFKVGDKVKLPKTKTAMYWDGIDRSGVIKKAKELNQDYLFINKIYHETHGDEYVLDTTSKIGGGDIFSINDLEHYEEKYIKTEKPIEIAEQILKGKIKYKVEGNKTTVKFSDGSTGFSKCCPKDEFSLYYGLALATGRAIYGQEATFNFGDKKLSEYTNEELINELANRMK